MPLLASPFTVHKTLSGMHDAKIIEDEQIAFVENDSDRKLCR